jgi:hypothetical protein
MDLRTLWLAAAMVVWPFAMALPQGVNAGAAVAPSRLNLLSLRLGLLYGLNRDLLASPFAYHMTSLPIGLHYDHLGGRNRHEAWIGAALGTIRSGITGSLGASSHQAEDILLSFGYGYGRVLPPLLGRRTALYLGAAWDNVFTIRNYDYGRGLEQEAIGEVFSALNLRLEGDHAFSPRHDLRLIGEWAPAAFAFRNPYALSTDALGDVLTKHNYVSSFLHVATLETVSQFLSIRARVLDRYRATSHVAVVGEYQLRVFRFANPRPSKTIDTFLTCGVGYVF